VSYSIRESERGHLWTVGLYKPDGEWQSESDHGTHEEAVKRCSTLNGSGNYSSLCMAVAFGFQAQQRGWNIEKTMEEFRLLVHS
jgi:hypothetical protein